MSTIVLLCIIASAISTASVAADGITTYMGVKKAGPGIEGDTSWFTEWEVHNPWLLPWFQPLLWAALCAVFIWAGPHTDTGGYAMDLIGSILMTIMRVNVAYANYQINKTLK